MIVEYLFNLKYKMYKDVKDIKCFIKDMNDFSNAVVDYTDRLFFYVKKDDKIISNFIFKMMGKYKCEMDILYRDYDEYNILKYKLFKRFYKEYPEIVMDTDFQKLNIVNVKFKK